MTLSNAEQLLIELINRARLDPLGEAERFGLADLNEGVAALGRDPIPEQPMQPLAPDEDLHAASQVHSEWMLATDQFQHEGPGDKLAADRMADAGFILSGNWAWAENLAFIGSGSGNVDLDEAIVEHNRGLFLSESHRVNTLDPAFREIGVAQVAGDFTSSGVTRPSSMLTENFALSGNERFVTGVAYDDTDGNGFYSIGEGTSGTRFSIGGASADSGATGGYALGTPATGMVTVDIDTGTRQGTVQVDLSQGNVKLDVVDGDTILTSGAITLVDGFDSVQLLGAANREVQGGPGDEVLTGSEGNNRINGGGGNDWIDGGDGFDFLVGGDGDDTIIGGTSENDVRDQLFGGAGDDLLDGGHGNDVLRGDAGNDTLRGGFGADELFGGDGDDQINGGAFSDLIFGGAGDDFVNGGFGSDRINGGTGADTFFHLGVPDHGSDWIQDFSHAEGDVLRFGQEGATANDFMLQFNSTPEAGADDVQEVFIVYKPTGSVVWALIDGAANDRLMVDVAGSDAGFDLLA